MKTLLFFLFLVTYYIYFLLFFHPYYSLINILTHSFVSLSFQFLSYFCTSSLVLPQREVSKLEGNKRSINYPSISIGELKRNRKRTIIRHVMNVESSNSTYRVTLCVPRGLSVKVSPNKMVFHESRNKVLEHL